MPRTAALPRRPRSGKAALFEALALRLEIDLLIRGDRAAFRRRLRHAIPRRREKRT